MKQITEYLTTKVSKSVIKATDETIQQIVKEEMDKYGHDCNLNHIDVSEVTDMDSLFSCFKDDLGESYSDLNPDVSEWNVSNVIGMEYMFYKCIKFNCDLSMWDVSNVIDLGAMFYDCNNFNQNLSKWDVSNAKNMSSMFCQCKSFNQDLSNWDVHNVTAKYKIFYDCPIEEIYKPKFK